MRTERIAAGLAAITAAGAVVLVAGLAPAQAATDAAQTTAAQVQGPAQLLFGEDAPVTTANGTRTLIVDPVTGLAATGAQISVQGKGFDTGHGLYVAVCADGSGAPADLSTCVGGSIPDANITTAWAHITTDGQGTGGVRAAWGSGGSFLVTLTLPAVTEGDLNCVTGRCSLYTSSDDDTVRSEDNTVPLTFAQPSSSSSAPPTAPGTATPEVIGSPTVVAGQNQIVAFSGFKPAEQVNLTLFSRQVALPPVTANSGGVARAQFTVPADTTEGTHRLEAIGQTSGTVGVASFQVTLPPVTSPSPSASPSPSPSPSPSHSPSPTPSISSAAGSSAPATPPVASSSAVTPSGGSDAVSRWWPWLLIAIVVIAGIVTGMIVRRRKQQEQREQDERDLATAHEQEQAAGYPGQPGGAPTVLLPPVPPPSDGPPPGQDPYGLLSGRDHPDNPQLYSGQDAGPTQVLGPTQILGPPGGRPPPYPGVPGGYGPPPGWDPPAGAPTQAIGPEDPPTGPIPPVAPPSRGWAGPEDDTGTAAWTPDLDDSDDDSSGSPDATDGGDGPRQDRR